MPVESAADLASFFDEDEFALAAEWWLAGGVVGWPVSVVLDRPDELVDLAGGPGLSLPHPRARVRVSELPAGYAKGDTLVVTLADATTATYTVGPIDLDETRTVAVVKLKAT